MGREDSGEVCSVAVAGGAAAAVVLNLPTLPYDLAAPDEERLAPEEARLPLEEPALERPLEPRPDLWASVDPSIRKLAKRATMTVIRSFRCNMRIGAT